MRCVICVCVLFTLIVDSHSFFFPTNVFIYIYLYYILFTLLKRSTNAYVIFVYLIFFLLSTMTVFCVCVCMPCCSYNIILLYTQYLHGAVVNKYNNNNNNTTSSTETHTESGRIVCLNVLYLVV